MLNWHNINEVMKITASLSVRKPFPKITAFFLSPEFTPIYTARNPPMARAPG
jgi:hypothetical protein